MLEPEERYAFLTPERHSNRHKPSNNTTTAIGTKFNNYSCTQSPSKNVHQTIQVGITQNSVERLRWLQSKVGQLKTYLAETPKVSRKSINEIFGWNTKMQEISSQRKLVKQLGVKVQMLLKQNTQLTSQARNTIDIPDQNQQLLVKEIGSSLSKRYANTHKQTPYKEIQENADIIEYMSRKKKDIQKLIVYQPIKRSPHKQQDSHIHKLHDQELHPDASTPSTPRKQVLNQELMSIQKTKGLKKYFTVYINTCIEENDQKFAATHKYIKSLEQRIKNFQKLQEKIDHLKFQKEVKLQQAERRSKLVSIAGPNVKGDAQTYAEHTESVFQQPSLIKQEPSINYFASKPKLKKIQNAQLEQQFVTLREENQYLRAQLQSLKMKYEKQIEKHIRDTYNYEELVLDKQRLQLEIMYLKDANTIQKSKK